MPKVKFVVATTNNINLDGMSFPEEMPILESFNIQIAPIATGKLYRKGNNLICEADVPELYINGFPYVQLEGTVIEEDGRKQIVEGKVIGVSIGMGPNQDETIRPISEQIKAQS